jgi:hypothetical protein
VTEEQLSAAAAEMADAEAIDPPPALVDLGRRLGLSAFEREALLLCAAIELDPQVGALCADAQGDPRLAHPTFALILSLFADPAWDVLSPQRGLRYWRLIEVAQAPGQPLITSPLRADERIVSYLKGLNVLDDRLAPLLEPVEVAQAEPPPSQQAVVDLTVRRLGAAAGPRRPLVQLLGQDAPSRQLVAAWAADRLGRQLYRLPVELLPDQTVELEALARLWHRESILLPLALFVELRDAEAAPDRTPLLARFLARSDGVVLISARELWPDPGLPGFAVDVERPTRAEQRELWAATLGQAAGPLPASLADQFDLDPASIREVGEASLAEPGAGDPGLGRRLWDACLARTRPRMDVLAKLVVPKAGWDDLVLPATETGLLHQIADQMGQRSTVYETWGFGARMNRGLGVSALFAGPSGTGKTMAAEVIADELRLSLYQVDLSGVVSKYIGETERNLRRLFDAAERGGACIVFNEADALFGKRSEVRDSHDRYANIEVNYLLQRMEDFAGLAILTTNMRSALDAAFLRRLRFVVTFPFPAEAERRRIWERVFPPATPVEDLDLDQLAKLSATGSTIHNIALIAAFLAAHQGSRVTMDLLRQAARTEFRKEELPVSELELALARPTAVPS